MSDRDTVVAALQEVKAILAADAALLAILKNPDEEAGVLRFFHVWARPNSTFPYMTASATVRMAGEGEDPYQVCDIVLDLWDADTSSLRLFEMRKRVKALLDRQIVECDEFNGRLRFTGDFDLSEPEAEVWRRSTSWTMRFYPKTEVADLQART